MNRTAELRPKHFNLARKPLVRMSAKRAKLNRLIGPVRKEYATSHKCVIDLLNGVAAPRGADDAHEIHGGANRQTTVRDPRFWLPVSRWNHQVLQDKSKAQQWAMKIVFFPEEFDVKALSELPGVFVDRDEVLTEVAELLGSK